MLTNETGHIISKRMPWRQAGPDPGDWTWTCLGLGLTQQHQGKLSAGGQPPALCPSIRPVLLHWAYPAELGPTPCSCILGLLASIETICEHCGYSRILLNRGKPPHWAHLPVSAAVFKFKGDVLHNKAYRAVLVLSESHMD